MARPLNSALPPLLFALAVVAHAGVLVLLGHPSPGGPRADANVYLELAMNLWREGTYGTKVSITYPPLYPMLLAPTFALASNAARFTAIYCLHAALLGLGSLALFPMARASLGRTRAWGALALLQLAGGAALHGYNTQSEPLFTALLAALVGVAWSAFSTRKSGAFVLLGVLAGLSVCTREMGVVLPLALALVFAHEGQRWRREGGPSPLRPALYVLLGMGLGLAPKAVAELLHGDAINPYGRRAALAHLNAGRRALLDPSTALLLLRLVWRHVSYVTVATFGAPIVLGALLWRRADEAVPLPLRRAALLLVYVGAGLIALTSLHMVRFWLRPGVQGYDLYPRYVDPLEPALLLLGLVAAAWMAARAEPRERFWGLGRLAPWTLLALGGLVAGGPLRRPRGGRILHPDVLRPRLDGLLDGLGAVAPWAFFVFSVVVLVLWALRARRGTLHGLQHLALAVVVSWALSWHSLLDRLVVRAPRLPDVLMASALADDPRGVVAVIVQRPGPEGRDYYEPAFRSDHHVSFIAPPQVQAWALAHPEGHLLHRKGDKKPALVLRQRTKAWVIYRAEAGVPEAENAVPARPDKPDRPWPNLDWPSVAPDGAE